MRPLFALFLRSLQEESRARLPPILRTALIVIILLIMWENQRAFGWRTAPGREFFLMVMMLNLGFIGLAALSIFPSAIAEEKEDDTLPLLRMTNLSALSILFGKSTSRLLTALLLLAVQVPFTLLAITLGGVSGEHIWSAYAILGATTFFLCNLSLLASVYCRTTMRAGFLTATLGAFVYAILPFIVVIATPKLLRLGPGRFSPVTGWENFANWVVEANPMAALLLLLETRMGGRLSMAHIWGSLGGGVFCFLLAWLIFDRYCTRTEESLGPRKKVKAGRTRRRWAHVGRTWSRLPLTWKDFHFMIGGRFGLILRFALGAAIFAGAYSFVRWVDPPYSLRQSGFYHSDRFWQEVSAIVGVIVMCCAGLEILLLAGRIFGVERRRLTLPGLVGLPWKVGKIIRQKLLGCLPVLLPWLVLAGAALALAIAASSISWHSFNEDLREAFDDLRKLSWRYDGDEIATVCYVFLQGLLLLVTIVWFSLRIRRGALPAAIAVLAVWNTIFGLIMDDLRGDNLAIGVLVGALLTLPALVLMCAAVHRRIQLAAAEE